jgi:hypothetical protein
LIFSRSDLIRSISFTIGDRQNFPFPNYIGATDYSGRLFRGNAAVAATDAVPSPQWDHLTDSDAISGIPGGGTLSGSSPHADCRDLEVRADGHLLESNDGGITLRTSPGDKTGDWFSLCGNMQVFESHNIAYEPVLDTVIFGNQDTGTIVGTLGDDESFTSIRTADGGDVMIDYKSDAAFIYLYFSYQKGGSFSRAKVMIATGAIDSITNIYPGPAPFVSVLAMNPNDQKVFAFGKSTTSDLFLTKDRGDNYVSESTMLGSTPTIGAMVWSADGSYLYVAEYAGRHIARCDFDSVAGDLSCTKTKVSSNSDSKNVLQLAVDPSNNNNVVAAICAGSAYSSPGAVMSTDGGDTWTDITVTGSLLAMASSGGAVAYIPNADGSIASIVAVGTSDGVLIPDGAIGDGWKRIAERLPRVPVLDMAYYKENDKLVVATLGRGVWYLDGASTYADESGSRKLVGGWRSLRGSVGGSVVDDFSDPTRQRGLNSVDFKSLLQEQSKLNMDLMPPESPPDDEF